MIQSSARTKRRKIKNELEIINSLYYETDNCVVLNAETEIYNNNEIKSNVISQQSINNNVSSTNFSSTSTVNANLANIILSQDTTLSKISTSNQTFSEQVQNSIDHNSPPRSTTLDFLSNWATTFNIPQNAVSGLLKGLKEHKCFSHFPVDSRTLLATPKQTSLNIQTVKPGSYFHFGLAKGILRYASSDLKLIKLAIGIDGLPISKSSGGQLWPIMAYIITDPPFHKKVFPVGIYYGFEKPKDSNEYLLEFVTEAANLINNGINLNNVHLDVSISIICCDTPAKSFILKIKGHSGFSSYTRCCIEGEYINSRVCFPYSCTKSKERTHEAYLSGLDEDYHISTESKSNLIQLPNFDIVKSFPLDYMHLVCLGVMKKLLLLWINKGPLIVRIRAKKMDELSNLLLSLNTCLPSDFARKIRGVQDIMRWKATEYRMFLLYLGPIVLKSVQNEECYHHFMVLNISMIILLSPDYKYLIGYARKLLDYFVHKFQLIYGNHLISHNIHGLLHLCDDYDQFGPLDNCSCFVFENYMKELKSLIRKHEMPLQQIVNRYFEKYSNTEDNINNITNIQKQIFAENPILKKTHTNGPLIENLTGLQYYNLSFQRMEIKIKKENDSFILTKDKQVVKCLNIISNDSEIIILGKYFKSVFPFFSEPIDSSKLDIFLVENLSDNIRSWKISEISKKVMILKNENQFVAMPILHTTI